jgi:hypothetical protein
MTKDEIILKITQGQLLNVLRDSNNLSESDIEDILDVTYAPFKEDFELLWEERETYHNFENWWNDFIRLSIHGWKIRLDYNIKNQHNEIQN